MKKIVSLQFLRAFACLYVLFTHVLQSLQIKPLGNYYISGGYGVDLFFILSGFLIYLTTKNSDNVTSYAIKRIFRIFPLYWFCVLLYLSWDIFYRDQNYSLAYYIQNFVMLPWDQALTHNSLIVGVAWSTVYEIYFYTVMGILLLFKIDKKYVIMLLLTLFGIFRIGNLTVLSGSENFKFLYSVIAYTHIVPFILGIAIAKVFQNNIGEKILTDFKYRKAIFVLVHVVFLLIITQSYNPLFSYLITSILFILWLHVDLIWKVDYSSSISQFLLKMGDISFSIYLVHILVIEVLISYFAISSLWILMLLTYLITIGASLITYNFIEKPFIGFSKSIISRQSMNSKLEVTTESR